MEDETIRQKIAEEKEILRKIAMQSEPKNEPQPEADRPKQIPAVIGCDSGWIKCSDRLPGSGKHVIGCIKDYYGEYSVTQVFYVDRWYDIVMVNDTIDVTHWMPLPEPPNHGR